MRLSLTRSKRIELTIIITHLTPFHLCLLLLLRLGRLHFPNAIDRSLNETSTDKIRKYRADYNNNPPDVISFMPIIASTSGRLHSEFVRLLFLHTHRETDLFFAASGVQLA
jgi:hypothetical protein